MNIAKQTRKMSMKECDFIGCTNIFEGSQFEKYCKDPRCIETRLAQRKTREKKKDLDTENLILKHDIYGIRIPSRKMLNLRCRARTHNGVRCSEIFSVLYEKNREIYPKYCTNHRNTHQRNRFERGLLEHAIA